MSESNASIYEILDSRAALLANEAGIAELQALYEQANQKVSYSAANIAGCQAAIDREIAHHFAINKEASAAALEFVYAGTQNIDDYLANDRQETDIAARRRADLKQRSEFLSAALARVVTFRLPFSSIQKLKAEADHAGTVEELTEVEAVLALARRRVLLQPVWESEGQGVMISGGASDEAVAKVIKTRAEHAQRVELYQQATRLFEENQAALKN